MLPPLPTVPNANASITTPGSQIRVESHDAPPSRSTQGNSAYFVKSRYGKRRPDNHGGPVRAMRSQAKIGRVVRDLTQTRVEDTIDKGRKQQHQPRRNALTRS